VKLVLSNRLSYLLAVLILLTAVFLRMARLSDLPSGLHDGEIRTIRLAETVRQGVITILFEDASGTGNEMLVPTVLAATTTLTGNGPLGYRMVSVWAALVTLALVYTLGVRLFGRVAGLAAMALLAVTFWHILLSRNVLVEAFLPLLIVIAMLSLARAIPVYRVARQESATTAAFASLAVTLGIGFYVHPMGLLLAMATMIFITYVILTRRPIERQRLSYIGFTILIVLILTIPYLVFNVNRPELATGGRLIGNYDGLLNSLGNGIRALFWQGDLDPAHNLPARPLFDPISAIFIMVGFGVALLNVRTSRYMLVVVFLVVLSPSALLTTRTPNFLGMTMWLVPLALLFGAGVHVLLTRPRKIVAAAVGVGVCAVLAFNLVWSVRDFFQVWAKDESVQQVYHTDLYQLARHLDRSMSNITTVICYPQVNITEPQVELNNTQKLVVMTNRQLENVRFVDCNNAMLFTQGGERQQLLIVEADGYATMHPLIQQWVSMGMFLTSDKLPLERVVILTVGDMLANRLGAYTTTDPANYGYETPQTPQETIYPPVRFGGNITWLGYEPNTPRQVRAGDTVDVINYWRVESGRVPSDLTLFAHILSDPVTVVHNRDLLSVDVSFLQERDVFVQVSPIALSPNMLAGRYQVSIGAYQQETLARLPVFDENQVRQGDRLILYPIEVVE
jgi:hypothetical protein